MEREFDTGKNGNEQSVRWNGHSGRVWVEAQAVIDRMFKPIEDLLVEVVRAIGGEHVLDVGCGTGGTTVAVARMLGGRGRCTGIDLSEPMIAAARMRAEREGQPAVFVRADAQTHLFESASFDVVMSRFGVMFFDTPVAAFENLRRAARDGAKLRCVAWRSPAENPFMTAAERAAAPLLPGFPARRHDAPGQFAFADRDRVATILRDSGWTDIKIHPIDIECILPEAALVGYLSRMGPVGFALQDADDATRARVIEAVRPAFDPYVDGSEVRFKASCWMIGASASDT